MICNTRALMLCARRDFRFPPPPVRGENSAIRTRRRRKLRSYSRLGGGGGALGESEGFEGFDASSGGQNRDLLRGMINWGRGRLGYEEKSSMFQTNRAGSSGRN